MKHSNSRRQKISEQLSSDEAKAFASQIGKLENEVEAEELYGSSGFDWRVTRVGEVGSDSWNMHMQEIELELEKKLAQQAAQAKIKELNRIKELAGIAKPEVEALATKQSKRQIKKP